MKRPSKRSAKLEQPTKRGETAFGAGKKQYSRRAGQRTPNSKNMPLAAEVANEASAKAGFELGLHQDMLKILDPSIEHTPHANAPGIAKLLAQRSKLLSAMFTRQLTPQERRTLDTLNAQLEKNEILKADEADRIYDKGRARRIDIALDRLGVMIERLAYRPTQNLKP